MSTIAGQPTGSRRVHDANLSRLPAFKPAAPPPASTAGSRERGGKIVFEVPFTSAMTGTDMELLGRQLNMASHADHKLPVDPNSPAVGRLDDYSSLILERGEGEDRWVLRGRTWGSPSTRTVHEWHVRTALIARQLDPSVPVPARADADVTEPPVRPVGKASSGRLSHLRRRLVGMQ